MMTAEVFYETFRKYFSSEKSERVRKAYKNKKRTLKDKKWTELMNEVLRDMMSDNGFEREDEQKIGQGRLDEKWQKGGCSVFIEHENVSNVDKLMNEEVRNLLNSDGDLRVLFTYFYRREREKQKTLIDGILKKLKNEKKGRNFEFLLVIGIGLLETPNDWEAYLYRPTFEYVPIRKEAEVNL